MSRRMWSYCSPLLDAAGSVGFLGKSDRFAKAVAGHMKSPVLIIGNPGAGTYSRRKIDDAVRFFSFFGTRTDVFLTRKKGDAETRAREALNENPALIVVAGGDGTINDVTNGIALSDIPLAVLPMGSINVLSREVGIPVNVEKALHRIISGKKHSISLGMINGSPAHRSRYFLLMGDVGYGGSTTYEINHKVKRYSARCAFVISGVKNLMKSRPDRLNFLIDGEQYEGYHAIIGNVSRYAEFQGDP